jgi:hypothetical protein
MSYVATVTPMVTENGQELILAAHLDLIFYPDTNAQGKTLDDSTSRAIKSAEYYYTKDQLEQLSNQFQTTLRAAVATYGASITKKYPTEYEALAACESLAAESAELTFRSPLQAGNGDMGGQTGRYDRRGTKGTPLRQFNTGHCLRGGLVHLLDR